MNLSLHISVGGTPRPPFSHAGPVVEIGRDPACELPLSGDAAAGVSFRHARIELTPAGAFLTDLNSSNGTLLNDTRIHQRVPLRHGDRVQLGYTGPVLEVTGLKLPPEQVVAQVVPPPVPVARPVAPLPAKSPRPAASSATAVQEMRRLQTLVLAGFGVVGAIVVFLVIVMLLRRPDTPPVVTATPPDNAPKVEPKAPPDNAPKVEPKLADPGKQPDPVNPPPPPPPLRPVDKELGRYFADAKQRPSVLLQRQGGQGPWGRLKDGHRVVAEHYLLALPGYRCEIQCDGGAYLTLWGNVPEFSPFPPVLESVVILNAPPAGFDLALTLDHGRVVIANTKKGPLKVRARFLQEEWDVTLPESNSEAALELWGEYPNTKRTDKPGMNTPATYVGLFAKGQVTLGIQGATHSLANGSCMVWMSTSTKPEGPTPLGKLPEWWTDKMEINKDRGRDAMFVAMSDLANLVNTNDTLPEVIYNKMVVESTDVPNRVLGVLFLGALDALPQLVSALEDRQYSKVRGVAAFVLRRWISRGSDYEMELFRTLQQKGSFPRDEAELLVRLLHDFTPEEINEPATFSLLLDMLQNDRIAIRELAYGHLLLLVPDGATFGYDVAADKEARAKGFEKWKQLLAKRKPMPR